MAVSTQKFWLTHDADANTTIHGGARPVSAGPGRLWVVGPCLIAPPRHAMPPGEFARWVARLVRQGYAVKTPPR